VKCKHAIEIGARYIRKDRVCAGCDQEGVERLLELFAIRTDDGDGPRLGIDSSGFMLKAEVDVAFVDEFGGSDGHELV
jgi:hypothetical protein